MSKALPDQLPLIIANARRDVERILETHRFLNLETREWVLPAKDSAILDWIKTDKRRKRMNTALDFQPNRLIHGNDLLVMAALLAEDKATLSVQGRLDLIYMDSLFCFGEDFQTGLAPPDKQEKLPEIASFPDADKAACDIASYLSMLVPRLLLMWELLSDRGLICMRVGSQTRCYAHMIICDMFGRQSLVESLILADTIGNSAHGSRPSKKFPDTVLIFGKREAGQSLHGVFSNSADRNIEFERKHRSRPRADAGLLHASRNGDDGTSESTGLLEAIMSASTRPDSIVADFSGGFGDTAVIAERLGRRWITAETGDPACATIRKRLIHQNAEPFLYQAIDGARDETAQALSCHAGRTGDLSQIVLLLYGAEPLLSEEAPDGDIGQVLQAGRKILVLVEPSNELIGLEALRKALKRLDRLAGGWDRLVVLGWKFEPSIDASIRFLNDSRLEVLAIPSNLLETLKGNGNAYKLDGQVHFPRVHACNHV
jgi:hypothetical protein